MHMLATSKHTQRENHVITAHHRRRHLQRKLRIRLATRTRLQILASYLCSMTRIMLCIPLRETTGKRPCLSDRMFPYVLFDSRYFATCRPSSIPGAAMPWQAETWQRRESPRKLPISGSTT